MTGDQAAGQDHPAPQRGGAHPVTLWLGLLLAPAAWFLQMTIDTTLLSVACYPHDVPLARDLPVLVPVVLATDAAALVLTAAAALLAWRNWRRTAGEKAGDGQQLLASGDGRTRFMAMAGLIVCGLVAVAVLYIGAGHLLLRDCGL